MKKKRFIGYILLAITLSLTSCMMMRPMNHSGHGIQYSKASLPDEFYDPVCGTKIENAQNELSYEYSGEFYYFHNYLCLNQFRANPANYIDQSSKAADIAKIINAGIWGLGGVTMLLMMLLLL